MLIVIKEMTTKEDGRKFIKASAKGKYLPEDLKAEAETYYDIKVVKGNKTQLPTTNGVYRVETKNCWLDKREGIKYPTCWIKDDEVKFTFYKNI